MLNECDRCELRDRPCPDCVVMAFVSRTGRRCEIGEAERRALRVLAEAGLVAPPRAGRADGEEDTLRKAS
jgi:hypothetical protein